MHRVKENKNRNQTLFIELFVKKFKNASFSYLFSKKKHSAKYNKLHALPFPKKLVFQ